MNDLTLCFDCEKEQGDLHYDSKYTKMKEREPVYICSKCWIFRQQRIDKERKFAWHVYRNSQVDPLLKGHGGGTR